MDLEFEWDEEKDRSNQMKHGVSFKEAAEVFYDPKCIELYDREHSLFENRWIIYGLAGCNVLRVSFTERNGVIRIISARKADREEEEEYFRWVW